ncbi:MAG: CPBP family intramembrane metalloprotease [Prevotella sp.]|nr:CPBP family intramembrane metalloprotease [Prevotella sp.]
MNCRLRAALEAVLFVVLFLLLQLVCAACLTPLRLSAARALVLASGISSAVAIVMFIGLGWAVAGVRFLCPRNIVFLFCTCVLAMSLILPLQFIEDFFSPDMPDELARAYEAIINSRGGYIVLGVVAPVAEETVFRGALLRRLACAGCKEWTAIVLSAIVFGAVHGNAAQFVHAFLVGLLLGWLYVRTRSIVPCVAVHWVNNTVAYVLVKLFPDRANDSVAALFGGHTALLCSLLALSAGLACVTTIILVRRLKKTDKVCNIS